LVTDAFLQEWRFWIATIEEHRSDEQSTEDPLFHMVHHAFSASGARDDRLASDLIDIYDALTGSRLGEKLLRPTKDPRRLLRGFDRELKHVLYGAIEAGILKFERHEMPWPFPEKEEKPDDKESQTPTKEDETYFFVRLLDDTGQAVDSTELVFTAAGQTRTITTDGAGVARWDRVHASSGSVRLSSIAKVREKLEERWKSFTKRRIPEGNNVVGVALCEEVGPVPLEAKVETTLVLLPFRISLVVGGDNPWGEDDTLVLRDSGGNVAFQSRLGDGIAVGGRRVFTYAKYKPGEPYQGEIHFNGRSFVLFAPSDLEPVHDKDSGGLALVSPPALDGSQKSDDDTVIA